jgi:hypothetical protein
LSRYEGRFVADGEAAGQDLASLRYRLAQADNKTSEADRRQAIVCVLNAAEGWREASRKVSGAFAGECAKTTDESQDGKKE